MYRSSNHFFCSQAISLTKPYERPMDTYHTPFFSSLVYSFRSVPNLICLFEMTIAFTFISSRALEHTFHLFLTQSTCTTHGVYRIRPSYHRENWKKFRKEYKNQSIFQQLWTSSSPRDQAVSACICFWDAFFLPNLDTTVDWQCWMYAGCDLQLMLSGWSFRFVR